jgi:glycine C-acetyltransferase
LSDLADRLEDLRGRGLHRRLRLIGGPQGPRVLLDGRPVLLLCSNNYLGLADHPKVRRAAAEAAMRFGAGAGASRLVSGNMGLHGTLEGRIAEFEGRESALLFGSGYLANLGTVSALAGRGEVVFSDELNHASIIDGVRLSKAKRLRYKNNDLADLEAKLQEADAAGARFKLIATDGVFSMDGIIADLAGICDLADRYGALVMVDDSHAVGFIGANGRGTPEHCGVLDRVDIITGTLGKALGGASGGYVAAHKEVIELLRQRSRPYLFSNTLAPSIAAATLKVLELLSSDEGNTLRQRVHENGRRFRAAMSALGFTLVPGDHPIIPVMLGDAQLASKMADALLDEGVYVIGFSFPVVPKGRARIRTQMSAAHTPEQVDRAIDAFARVGRKLGVI